MPPIRTGSTLIEAEAGFLPSIIHIYLKNNCYEAIMIVAYSNNFSASEETIKINLIYL
jgi:hypothetical protein